MNAVWSIAVLNLLQGLRTKLAVGVAGFFGCYLALCVLLGVLSPGESEKVLRDAGLAGVELTGLILVVLNLAVSFYQERDSRMVQLYLTHVSRSRYLAGKLLGSLLICLAYLLAAGLGYLLILACYQAFLWQVLVGLYGLFLKLAVVIGVGLVFCCVCSSAVVAVYCTLVVYLSGEVAHVGLETMSRGAPAFQKALYQCLYAVLPNMDKLNLKAYVVHGALPAGSYLLMVSLYSGLYVYASWLLARTLFLRQEF